VRVPSLRAFKAPLQGARLETRTKEFRTAVSLEGADPPRRKGNCVWERQGEDPKDSELSLGRMRLGETPMEVRSAADVQIARRTWT